MKTFLLAVIFLLGGCTAPSRVQIELHSTMDVPVEIVASYGVFSQSVTLWPGITWAGYIPVREGGKVNVVIRRR